MPLITITLHTVAPVTKDTAIMVAAAACRSLDGATYETDAEVLIAECSEVDAHQEQHLADHHKKVASVVRRKSAPRAGAQ